MKIYVKKSKFGRGVFANKEIKKGEEILMFKGKVLNVNEVIRQMINGRDDSNLVQIGNNTYFDIKEPGVLVNHSCNPNAGLINSKILIAIKNIKKNEQIFFDYSTCMNEDDWTMECKCENKNCRKIIKDFKYLPKKIEEKYLKLKIVPKWLIKSVFNSSSS